VTREHPASEVYVTGTFDDWAQSEKLVKTGDHFAKEVTLPSADEKIYYKVRDETRTCPDSACDATASYIPAQPAHFGRRRESRVVGRASACCTRERAAKWLPAVACFDLALSGPSMQSHTGSRHATPASRFGARRVHDVPFSDSLPPPLQMGGSGEAFGKGKSENQLAGCISLYGTSLDGLAAVTPRRHFIASPSFPHSSPHFCKISSS
jgi:Glycogen recognition site of AMP-activated protein kinase